MRRKAWLADGAFTEWVDQASPIAHTCALPGRHIITHTLPDQRIKSPAGDPTNAEVAQTVYITEDSVQVDLGFPPVVMTFDLNKVRAVKGEAKAQEMVDDMLCDVDPMWWLSRLDPETAEVVEEKEVPLADGDDEDARETETLYVIEGKPKDPALLAEAEERKDLPIEPLVRITVGEDGFPRHVLVQCYCPKWDVLELTVTDYELNPDLPDDLFQFTPPQGVQVIEADPSMWK